MKNITINSKVFNLEQAECIGEGNFAKVYKTFSKELKQNVAVRVVQKSPQEIEDLLKEKNINRDLMKVDSPFILHIFEIQETDKLMLYVTEFCQGGSLWDCLGQLSGNRMDQSTAIEMGLQIAKGLQVLHNNKITHRDLKPENILLEKKFVRGQLPLVKIADFGLSTKKLIMETLAGTKQYIAPEQAKYQSYTNAVDVWALGIIIDEMLHGSAFYSGENNKEIFSKIANELYVVRDSKILPELQDLLIYMLRKKPFQRPTIGEIILKLEAMLRKNTRARTPNQSVAAEEKPAAKLQEIEFRGVPLPVEQFATCSLHQLPATIINEGRYLCDTCFDQQTVPVEQYLSRIEPLSQKLFRYQPAQFNPKWDLKLNDEQLRTTFERLKEKFGIVNMPIKRESEVRVLIESIQDIRSASQELEDQYKEVIKTCKNGLLEQLDPLIDEFLNRCLL